MTSTKDNTEDIPPHKFLLMSLERLVSPFLAQRIPDVEVPGEKEGEIDICGAGSICLVHILPEIHLQSKVILIRTVVLPT